ncbi:MAG: TIM23 complex component [Tremellales sp. Tagirdzhanova-0007]|nr:MAG: TIM23 complex component [Tremellales sp. Tagirdzhanova-0007]
MGVEPMFVYGGATLGCMALGYLLGPTLGSSLFSFTHPTLSRGNPAPLEIMDRELFARIRRNRVDPSFQSVNNPAPDFYGEKIVSLPTYRRWLRDQTAYKRKAMHGVPADET